MNSTIRTCAGYIILVVLLYLYLNNPLLVPLGGIGSTKLLYLLLFFFFITKNNTFKSYYSNFKREAHILYGIVVYISLRTFLQTMELTTAYTSFVMVVESLFVPIAFIFLFERYRFSFENYVRLLLMVGALGSVISSACFFLPEFNEFVKTSVVIVQANSYLDLNVFRGYGISDGLTYSFGIIQGFIFSLGLIYLDKNKWFMAFLPLMVLSILVNARTGFLIALVGVVVMLLYKKGNALLTIIIAIASLTYFIPFVLSNMESATRNWLTDFFNELESLFLDKSLNDAGTALTLKSMIILPNNIFQWIIGRGVYLFGKASVGIGHTDIGWMLQLNHGGLIYLYIWFMFFKRLFKRAKFAEMDKALWLLIIATILIANSKGDMIANTGIMRMVILTFLFNFHSSTSKTQRLI